MKFKNLKIKEKLKIHNFFSYRRFEELNFDFLFIDQYYTAATATTANSATPTTISY